MKPPPGGTFWEEGTYFAARHLFFEFLASVFYSFSILFFQA